MLSQAIIRSSINLQTPRDGYKKRAHDKLSANSLSAKRCEEVALVDGVRPENESNDGGQKVEGGRNVLAESEDGRGWGDAFPGGVHADDG